MRCGFEPLIHSYEYPCTSQSFPSNKTAGVFFKDFQSQEYIQFFEINCGLSIRLHFSIGCYNRRRTSRWEFKSFLLIICIDAPESTTNSRSSGLTVDAGRLLFPKVRRMLLCFSPLISTHFGPASTLLHGTSLLPFRLFLRPILKFWSTGVTLMRITWANHSKRWILVSNVSMTYAGFSELNTSDWLPSV